MGTALHVIETSDIRKVVSSPVHPYVLTWGGNISPNPLTIRDARSDKLLTSRRPEAQSPLAFMPDGASFISSGSREGLTTWHIRPLLENWRRDGGALGSDSVEPASPGAVLKGPQVSPESNPSHFGR